MFKLNNPFRNPSRKEVIEQETERKRIDAKITSLAESARRCLDNEDFKRYREEFVKAEREINKMMIENVNPDPVKDAYFLRACLNKLSVIYQLTDMVEKDANRKVRADG